MHVVSVNRNQFYLLFNDFWIQGKTPLFFAYIPESKVLVRISQNIFSNLLKYFGNNVYLYDDARCGENRAEFNRKVILTALERLADKNLIEEDVDGLMHFMARPAEGNVHINAQGLQFS